MKIGFLYAGQGAHYVGMGKDFYEALGYRCVGSYDNAEDGYSEYFFIKRI